MNIDMVTVEGQTFRVSPETVDVIKGIVADEGRYAVKDCKTGDWVY